MSEYDLDREAVESTMAAIDACYEAESDSDHESALMEARGRLADLYDGWFGPIPEPDEEDVRRALDLLEELNPSEEERDEYLEENGERHPDRCFGWAFDFVDNAARYVNGVLPDPRDWNVRYEQDGEIIEERVYDHDDEIPINPVIDGTRYESVRTKRGNGEVVVQVEEDPLREDIHIVVNATGDRKDFVNLSAHPGPDGSDPQSIVNELCDQFEWGMKGETDAILREKPEVVYDYLTESGYEYEVN